MADPLAVADLLKLRRRFIVNYLIDGHNLIGKIDDIKLSDPDDEAKLVLRLINWAAVGKNRRVIVVFDGGVPGSNWANFKSDRVRPVFVTKGKTADAWLIRFMRDEVKKDVKSFHLVTSDNEIIKSAQNRRIAFTKSEEFADQIAGERKAMSELGQERVKPAPRPLMREVEVDAWLQFFGGEPEPLEVKPYVPKHERQVETVEAEALSAERPKTSEDPDDFLLSPAEIGDWLDMFGGEPNLINVRRASARSKRSPVNDQPTTQHVRPVPKNTPKVDPDAPISQDDVDLFHSLFGGDD